METGESSYRRFLKGDESAFHGVMEAYLDNLIFFIYRYVGDYQTAEDLAIDALLELIIHPHRYDFRRSLKTYLFTIGRNKALNHLKRERRVDYVANPDELSDLQSLEESVISRKLHDDFNRALSRLPDEMQIALHLVYLENLSYAEAASILKKSRKQIDNLLTAGKRRLREQLSLDGYDNFFENRKEN